MSISASAPATRATRISSACPAAQSSSAVLPTPASPRSTSTPLSPSRTAASTPSSEPVSTARPSNALIALPSSPRPRSALCGDLRLALKRRGLVTSSRASVPLQLDGQHAPRAFESRDEATSRHRAEPRSCGAFGPGLLTPAQAERHGRGASSPPADQLVFGKAVLEEKAFRVAVLDRV